MKNLLYWCVVVALALLAIGAFKDSVLAGSLIIAAAVFAAPPVWNAIPQLTFRKSIIAVLAVSGLVILTQSPGYRAEVAANEKKKAAEKQVTDRAASTEDQDKATPDNPYADEMKQMAWILTGKDTVKAKLKDPESADFRNVRFFSGGGIPVACGEVNAKNGFGGYNGFERFIATGPEGAFLESEVSDGIGKVWNRFCVAAPTDRARTD